MFLYKRLIISYPLHLGVLVFFSAHHHGFSSLSPNVFLVYVYIFPLQWEIISFIQSFISQRARDLPKYQNQLYLLIRLVTSRLAASRSNADGQVPSLLITREACLRSISQTEMIE